MSRLGKLLSSAVVIGADTAIVSQMQPGGGPFVVGMITGCLLVCIWYLT